MPKVGDMQVTLELDTSQFDDALDSMLKDTESRCKTTCRVCNVVQCVGKDPHEELFGPFHVFPQHDHFALNVEGEWD